MFNYRGRVPKSIHWYDETGCFHYGLVMEYDRATRIFVVSENGQVVHVYAEECYADDEPAPSDEELERVEKECIIYAGVPF